MFYLPICYVENNHYDALSQNHFTLTEGAVCAVSESKAFWSKATTMRHLKNGRFSLFISLFVFPSPSLYFPSLFFVNASDPFFHVFLPYFSYSFLISLTSATFPFYSILICSFFLSFLSILSLFFHFFRSCLSEFSPPRNV
jgi:hypothetical protein